jgi:16S rRNA (guanine1516-N2)-methyltransferase
MTVNFIRDGLPIIPENSEVVRDFCLKNQLNVTLEWIKGQYWLHSDLPGERPIGIEIDLELERHQNYFKKNSLHKEILARAVGIKSGIRPKILDLTAGLLGDSLLLLSMGCEVVSIERHPLVAFLIRSALANSHHPLLGHFHFQEQDAKSVLMNPPNVDVIFFDPMFEDPSQKASPRKEMRIFRGMVGEDQDATEVGELARSVKARRLVIKRPRLSVPLFPGKPLQYVGKATRYDVYLPQNNGPIDSNLIK